MRKLKYILFSLFLFLFFINVNAYETDLEFVMNYDDFSEVGTETTFYNSTATVIDIANQLIENYQNNDYYNNLLIFIQRTSSSSNIYLNVYVLPKTFSDSSYCMFDGVSEASLSRYLLSCMNFDSLIQYEFGTNRTMAVVNQFLSDIYLALNSQNLSTFTSSVASNRLNYTMRLISNSVGSSTQIINNPFSETNYAFVYYVSNPLLYRFNLDYFSQNNDAYSNSSTVSYRKLVLNQVEYNSESYPVSSYYDWLNSPSEDFSSIQFYTSFYGSLFRFQPSNLSSFDYSLGIRSYDGVGLDEISIVPVNFYGRKNNNSNYTYEKINCAFNSITDSTANDFYDIPTRTFKFSSIFCDSTVDLSLYDEILGNIYVLNAVENNGVYSSPKNGYAVLNTKTNSKTVIADDLIFDTNLTQYLFSTTSSNVVVKYPSYNSSVPKLRQNLYNLSSKTTSPCSGGTLNFGDVGLNYYTSCAFGTKSNTASMFYLDTLKEVTEVHYTFTFEPSNLLISKGVLNEDSYYYFDYFDSDGTINNSIFDNEDLGIDHTLELSSYFDKVTLFLDDIKLSIDSFSEQLQVFYNSMPTIIQTFLVVMFICNMIYITYRVIGK